MSSERSGTVDVVVDVDKLPGDLDAPAVDSLVRGVVDGEGAVLRTVTVVLTDHERVRPLNRDYLGHDYDTDVLAFSFSESDAEPFPTGDAKSPDDTDDPAPPSASRAADGEVYVDVETAEERHTEFGASVEEEVRRYVIHGLLHLLGYDDTTEAGNAEMRDLEDRYLQTDDAAA